MPPGVDRPRRLFVSHSRTPTWTHSATLPIATSTATTLQTGGATTRAVTFMGILRTTVGATTRVTEAGLSWTGCSVKISPPAGIVRTTRMPVGSLSSLSVSVRGSLASRRRIAQHGLWWHFTRQSHSVCEVTPPPSPPPSRPSRSPAPPAGPSRGRSRAPRRSARGTSRRVQCRGGRCRRWRRCSSPTRA